MKIDPRISFALNLALMILSGMATGAVHFTGLVPDPVAAQIIGWAGVATFILSTINTGLHGYSAATAGPLANSQPMTPPAKLGIMLALMIGVSFLSYGHAKAAPLPPKRPHHMRDVFGWNPQTNNFQPAKVQTPDQIVDKVRTWIANDGDADLAAAVTLAKASNNNVTLPCWTALQGFVTQIKAVPASDKLPPIHIATDIEILTDLMIALQPNSPVVAQCQALANYQKMSALNMVTGIVTGALSIAKLAPIIPIP